MNICRLTAGLLTVTATVIGLNMSAPGNAQDIEPCSELAILRMTNAVKAIFPLAQFGTPLHSFCEDPGAMGVDIAGILVFGENADVSSLSFGPLDGVPEGMPVERFDRLYPTAGLAAAVSDHLAAYGFDRGRNSGAYVVRRADGTGPVMVMVADLM